MVLSSPGTLGFRLSYFWQLAIIRINKRMPTILNEDLAYEWVFGNLSKDEIMDLAKIKYPTEQMDAWTVAKGFQTAFDTRKRFEYPGLPPLGSDEPFNPDQALSLF